MIPMKTQKVQHLFSSVEGHRATRFAAVGSFAVQNILINSLRILRPKAE